MRGLVFASLSLFAVLVACSGKVQTQALDLPPNCTKCDASPECFDLRVDPANCGACGTKCAAGQVCNAGKCETFCSGNLTLCTDRCADLQNDPKNCGTCGAACAGDACVKGKCTYGACKAGFADCDGNVENGCEKSVAADLASCGGCNVKCAPVNVGTAQCADGKCGYDACKLGFLDCDANKANGCEVDPMVDSENCGQCGKACTGGTICLRGSCSSPPPVVASTSFAYPSNGAGAIVAPRAFVLTLQTLGPGLIYYTTDGSTPTTGSARGVSPVIIPVNANMIVKWFTSLDPTVQAHSATINATLQGGIGEFMDQVRFDKSGGPVVIASPGEALLGLANQQVWNGQGYCPGCVRVYGIGVVSVEQCFDARVPPNWPGVSYNDFRFKVIAPARRGVYHLRRGVNLDYFCRPGTGVGGDDGTIIVQ